MSCWLTVDFLLNVDQVRACWITCS